MGFIDSIYENFGVENIPSEPVFRAVLFGDLAGYFENVLAIKSFSESVIEVRLKKGGINIKGENLYVKKFCAGDLVICGKITAVERT
ncbi:MAG: hypothetical protein E7362_04475 [Clostridiales bacterium]|nr:hypothetical protein [Clostridiales bacterium]